MVENPIRLHGKDGLFRGFEARASTSYRGRPSGNRIRFNAEELGFMGAYPAALFLAWVSHLRTKKKCDITVALPPEPEMAPQVRKMLVDLGIVGRMEELGVSCVPTPLGRSVRPPALPLTVLPDADSVPAVLDLVRSALAGDDSGTYARTQLAEDVTRVLVKELLENSFNHGGGSSASPYVFINHATAGPEKHEARGVMARFAEEEQYVEICVGDLGRGIHRTLKDAWEVEFGGTKKYHPPYRLARRHTKPEDVLLYSFEFASTRDRAAREAKYRELLEKGDGDPANVASGLYLVLGLAKRYAAQFWLRVPECVLSFDFTKAEDRLTIKGAREAGLNSSKLARIPGTHYVFRFRLDWVPPTAPSRGSVGVIPADPLRVEVFNPFPLTDQEEGDEAHALDHAVSRTNEYVNRNRRRDICVIIDPPLRNMSERVIGYYLYSVLSMPLGRLTAVWNAPRQPALTPSATTSPAAVPPLNRVYSGSLFSNSFELLAYDDVFGSRTEAEDRQTFRLSQAAYEAAASALGKAKSRQFEGALRGPSVSGMRGPFLVERRYYIEKFFVIAEAFKSPDVVRQFAVWARCSIEHAPQVIVAHSRVMIPAAKALAGVYEESGETKPAIAIIETPLRLGAVFRAIADHSGRRAIVLTDAVVTGDNIRDLLGYLAILDVERVLAAVDGRNESQRGTPIALSASGGPVTYPVSSIVQDDIPAFDHPPPSVEDEESLSVIDPATHVPKRYVRRVTPELDARLLVREAERAEALFEGHFAYGQTHYTQVFDLRKLFAHLRGRITSWIRSQIAFLTKHVPRHTVIALCDTEETMPWLKQALAGAEGLGADLEIRYLSRDELTAPRPPTLRTGTHPDTAHWIGVLPGITSADSALSFVEYASRHEPASIMVLGLLCRTGPRFLNLLSGVGSYRKAEFRFSAFARFPDSGYPIEAFACPLCILRRRLRAVQLTSAMPNLDRLVKSQITALGYHQLPIGGESGKEALASLPGVADRAYARALYESAGYDVEAKKEMHDFLLDSESRIDAFLHVLAREFLAPQFSHDEMQERLSDAFPAVLRRAREHLAAIGQGAPRDLVLAVDHLCPGALTEKGPSIMEGGTLDRADILDLCVAVLASHDVPEDLNRWTTAAESVGDAQLRALVEELVQYLHSRTHDIDAQATKCLESFALLFGDFMRSSPFVERLAELEKFLPERPEPFDRLAFLKACSGLWSFWQDRVLHRMQELKDSFVCRTMQSRRGVRSRLYELGMLVSDLYIGAESASTDEEFRESRSSLGETLSAIRRMRIEIGESLYEFACNATKCKIAQLDEGDITARDGSRLKFVKRIDYDVDLVFFLPEDFEFACGEIFSNWVKHKQARIPGEHVELTVSDAGEHVAVEFLDDIQGEVDILSIGGMNAVQEMCEDYGAEVQVREFKRKGTNWKGVKLLVRKLARDLGHLEVG